MSEGQNVLGLLYAVFAILYVFDIAYHAPFRYIGWTLINTLFISTILVLIKGYVLKKGAIRRG